MPPAVVFTLIFIANLAILVLFHEAGHFFAAKAVGMGVHEFAFGFGPRLFTIARRRGTAYTVHAIPAGGFVRIAGMDPGEEEVENGYYSKPYWKRATVLVAGSAMNLVLAILIFSAMGPLYGLPEIKDTAYALVGPVQTGSEAERMGLRPGDKIVEIVGLAKGSREDIVNTIHESAGRRLTLKVARDGESITMTGTPKETTEGGATYGAFGFTQDYEMAFVKAGLWRSTKRGVSTSIEWAKRIVQLILSRAVAQEVGGPVAIGYVTYEAFKSGFGQLVFWLAIISVNLAVVNLLPIPVLDGGHLLLMPVEKIYGLFRKGRKLPANTIYAVQAFGLLVIVSLFLMLTYRDIIRLATGQMP
jgi:regulator of sigma E protease